MVSPDHITIDPREGSKDLEPVLRKLSVPCQLGTLTAADFAWEGNGSRGPVKVGVERKRLGDALSCMTGGRFAGHQLPLLLREFDYAYLVVEGIWRANPDDGLLEERYGSGWRAVGFGRRRHMHRDLDNWLHSLMTQTSLRVRITHTADQTALMLRNMYHWWRKPWGDHASLHVVYTPPPPTAIVLKPGLVRRMAAQLRHIGWDRSAAVATKFRTPLDMALGLKEDWLSIPGIGEGIASSVIRQWQGEEEGD